MGQEPSSEIVDDSVPARTLTARSIQGVADFINSGKAEKIVVLTGAGLSTSAGIPDFRSPETGLYANLARLNLPYAEAVFDISYFREHPEPFYMLAKELYPGRYKPTVGHAFISLLAKKGLLRMLFTQNIDCLERAAGVPDEKIVEAHGSFATQRCIDCKNAYPDDLIKKAVEAGEVPRCLNPDCNGLVKPDIVFFGEALPSKFNEEKYLPSEADLLIIMGTSLTVHPFASLPQFAREHTPRVLINLERVGGIGSRRDDVCILSDIDSGVRKLAAALGWTEELEEHWKSVAGITADEAVGKGKSDGDVGKTKDELLAEEIEKLTKEVDETLELSSSHHQWASQGLEPERKSGLLDAALAAGQGDELKPGNKTASGQEPKKEDSTDGAVKEDAQKPSAALTDEVVDKAVADVLKDGLKAPQPATEE